MTHRRLRSGRTNRDTDRHRIRSMLSLIRRPNRRRTSGTVGSSGGFTRRLLRSLRGTLLWLPNGYSFTGRRRLPSIRRIYHIKNKYMIHTTLPRPEETRIPAPDGHSSTISTSLSSSSSWSVNRERQLLTSHASKKERTRTVSKTILPRAFFCGLGGSLTGGTEAPSLSNA